MSGSKIKLTILNMDIEFDDYWCGGHLCWCDYVEISGQRYCGTWNGTLLICPGQVKFKSDDFWTGNQGFRADWTEIPDDGECGLHILDHLSCV